MDKPYTIKIEKETFHFKDGFFTRLVHSHAKYRWTLHYWYDGKKKRPWLDSGYSMTKKGAEKSALLSISMMNQKQINHAGVSVLEGAL
jgi:hypothetical protein